jgi:hypothetical protein
MQEGNQFVQVMIERRAESATAHPNPDGAGPNWRDVTRTEDARQAVDVVLGEGREVEPLEFVWNVEFRPAEIAVLERQGYIDLEQRGYRISAEMP